MTTHRTTRNLPSNMKNASIFSIVSAKTIPIAPAEHWHAVRVRAEGPRVQVAVKGTKLVNANLRDHAEMSERIPGLTRTSGRLGLQIWDGPVEFRNVRVRRLSPRTGG